MHKSKEWKVWNSFLSLSHLGIELNNCSLYSHTCDCFPNWFLRTIFSSHLYKIIIFMPEPRNMIQTWTIECSIWLLFNVHFGYFLIFLPLLPGCFFIVPFGSVSIAPFVCFWSDFQSTPINWQAADKSKSHSGKKSFVFDALSISPLIWMISNKRQNSNLQILLFK